MSDQGSYVVVDNDLGVAEFRALLMHCGFRAAMLPDERLARMISGASILVSARIEGELVGVARAISDGAWITHISHIMVHEAHRGRGVGRLLIGHVRVLSGDECSVTLHANDEAKAFYLRLNFTSTDGAYVWPRDA